MLADHRQVDILLIYGLEEAIFAYEDVKKLVGWSQDQIRNYSWEGVPPILVNINQQRERFRDNLPIKFVFLVRYFTINYLIHRAPDFFDWRSGLFIFKRNQDFIKRETEYIIQSSNYSEYCQWDKSQRTAKICEIQELYRSREPTNRPKGTAIQPTRANL